MHEQIKPAALGSESISELADDPSAGQTPNNLPAQLPSGASGPGAWAPLSIPAYCLCFGSLRCSPMWAPGCMKRCLVVNDFARAKPRDGLRRVNRHDNSRLLFSASAGVWADRFNRRTWLLSSQLLLLAIAAVMALLAALNWITPTLLLMLTVAMGIGMILNQPAWQALTPGIGTSSHDTLGGGHWQRVVQFGSLSGTGNGRFTDFRIGSLGSIFDECPLFLGCGCSAAGLESSN